jgi:hypothetical protein
MTIDDLVILGVQFREAAKLYDRGSTASPGEAAKLNRKLKFLTRHLIHNLQLSRLRPMLQSGPRTLIMAICQYLLMPSP